MFEKLRKKTKNVSTDAEKKTKIDKKKVLLVVVLFLLVASGAGAFLVSNLMNRQTDIEVEEGLVESELYWNADRTDYVPKLGGVTMRKPEADGIYTVRFLVNGKLEEYRVKDKELMIEIDKESVMGLLFDEEGFIIEKVDLNKMGVREVAKSCYVQDVDGEKVTVNSSAIGDGTNIDLTIKKEVGIWNVTGSDPVGATTALQTLDCVRVFNREGKGITDVYVVTREDDLTGVSVEKYCEHCKQVVKWRMWIAENQLPKTEGHWRLIRDVNLAKQQNMAKGVEQIIDLNGKTVKAAHKSRMISLHNEDCVLSIMDLSEEKTGTLKGLGNGGFGSVVWVRYNGVFNLYSGTLDGSEVDASSNGAVINVQKKEGVFNMYGGTIIGGTTRKKVKINEETGKEQFTEGGAGGSLCVKGTVNMYGGVIRDGIALGGKNSKGDVKIGYGGNIHMLAEAVFNMYGGTISGGTLKEASTIGGNIRIAKNATFNMKGGVIEGGVCRSQGGNIGLYGTLNMSGGIIRNGEVRKGETFKKAVYNKDSLSHNIFCVNGTINMTGGLIEGYVRILDNGTKEDGTPNECTVKISGKAQIKGGEKNLIINSGDYVDFGTLKKGAAVYINGGGYVSTETIESNQQYVHSDYDVDVLYHNKRLLIGKVDCICGENHVNASGEVVKEHFGACDGTELVWAPWTSKSTLPIAAGNWYLISDVEPNKQFTVAANTNINLDLNGHEIQGKKNTRVYSLRNDNVVMTLTDLSDDVDGKIVAKGSEKGLGYGNCIWVSGASKLNMYNGELDATKVSYKSDGVAVNVSKNCEFTMYGGHIKGGTTKTNGGSVSVNGKFTMWGGTIEEGKAEVDGGNIWIASGGEFNLHDGKVWTGKAEASGGNIAGKGAINILGGEICYGQAKSGGNITGYNKLVLSGGLIKHGVANSAGNVFMTMNSSFVMTGGTISQGVAQVKTGGNIRTIPNCTVEISGGTIENGVAEVEGGNIWMNGGSLKMTGGVITGGRTLEGNGGNICTESTEQGGVTQRTMLNLRGGSIVSGCTAVDGGNIYAKKADIVLAGNITIKDGIQSGTQEVSNLYLTKGIVAKLDGLTGAKASIGITCEDSVFATDANADKSDIERFSMDDGYPMIAQSKAKELFVGTIGCMCGGHRDDGVVTNDGHEEWCLADMREIEWHAWRSNSSLPKPSNSGNYYYLTEDVNLAAQIEFSKAGDYGLDLNGHKVTQNSNEARVYVIWNTQEDISLNITDTSAERNGSIIFKEGTKSDIGGVLVWMRSYEGDAKHTVNVYAGALDSGNLAGKKAPIYLQRGTFNVYGGNILPKNQATADETTNGIHVEAGTLGAYGGSIEGEILLNKGTTLNVGGSPKVGVQVANNAEQKYGVVWQGAINLNATDVTDAAQIILKDSYQLKLAGTGDERAFTVVEKHNRIADDSNGEGIGNLQIVAQMCVCGAIGEHTGECKLPSTPWQPWNASVGKDEWNRVGLPWTAGSYYLTENMTELAKRADLNSDCTINLDLSGYEVKGAGQEGMIYRLNGGTLNIADSSEGKTGAIKCAGESTAAGRVVYVWGRDSLQSCVNLYGGTLAAEEGAIGGNGTIVRVNNGTFNMHGGTILPGTCNDATGANSVRIGNKDTETAIFNIKGGTIKGSVQLYTATAQLNVSGNAKVGVEETGKAYGISTGSAVKSVVNIACTNVTNEASVVLKDTAYLNITGTGDERAFTVIDTHNRVSDDSNGDGIGNLKVVARMCICGAVGEHTQVGGCTVPTAAWQPWDAAISQAADSSGRVILPYRAGSYYLVGDMTSLAAQAEVSSGIVTLDLNGHTAQSTSPRVYVLPQNKTGTLNITDSVGGGKLEYAGQSTSAGRVIWLRSGTVNLFKGTLTAKNATGANGIVVNRELGTFNMYDGTVEGNGATGVNAIKGSANINLIGGTVIN